MDSEPLQDKYKDQTDFLPKGKYPIQSIGTFLKASREQQNMSTAFLAASLRMGEEQLIALEEGDINLLPEPVFIKAMIRRVSERLKINPEDLIKELDLHKNDLGNGTSKQNKKIFLKLNDYIFKNISRKGLIISTTIIISTVTIIISLISKVNLNQREKEAKLTSKEFESSINLMERIEIEREIIISSLKPSKAKIVNKLGDVLFDGIINSPLKYNIRKGLEIYAYQPNLIEVKSEGMVDTVLGSHDEIGWYDLSSIIKQ